jgi:hypothetical protein
MRRDVWRNVSRFKQNLKTCLSRHHRPCAGDPDVIERNALRIGMAGTSPTMTSEKNRLEK